ncbi:transglycosylase SLT domain protein [Enterococcus sp. JM4C]|uniref:lysozyme family protein n=1 Tax=Candidatus Enterococcus huntleyi TaxID=1857217 RepID=UPI00137A9941|nr:lysozyme family protein [Enterococcus sp. JM4C]KAF1298107.1 transglycosylase SLT domain protein [Enterococcus sp. JM4C]
MRKRKKRRILKTFLLMVLFIFIAGTLYLTYQTVQTVRRVNQYEEQVEEAAEKNQISEYKGLLMAIIYTESKGKGIDLMQSSESAFGSQNQITTQEESIEKGVSYFAEVLAQAKDKGTDIWTAVQAYNYGIDYVNYIAENGGENTVELAEVYSRDVLSPTLGNSEKKQYRYLRIQSLLYNGGYLYHNGGNIFYADVVKTNQWIFSTTADWF